MMTTHEPLTFQDGLDPVKQLERFCQELREGDAFLAVEIEQSASLVRFDSEALVLAAYTPTKEALHNNIDLLQVRLSAYAPGCKLRIHGLLTDAQIAARAQATNKIPWTCYRKHCADDDDFYPPRDWYVSSFVDRRGRTLEFTHLVGMNKFHEYVLASMIGEWLLTGRRVLDFDNLSTRVRIKNLCHKITGNNELEQAIYERNKERHLAHLFVRAYTEFQYQTTPISLITARNLRFYETRVDMFGRCNDDFEVHHILPKCEFEEYETDLRNLIKIPKPVHQLLHDVYDGINNGEEPGEAFCKRWLEAVPYKFESEHDLYFPKRFFEDLYNEWFERRTDEMVIREKVAREMGYDMDYHTQYQVNLVTEWGFNGDLMGKNFFHRDHPHLPWWWTQHWAMIANMCAYLYADALQARLA